MQAVFTGFAAWSAVNSGAICDLLLDHGSLRLAADPVTANWDYALARAREDKKVDLQVWALTSRCLCAMKSVAVQSKEIWLARSWLGCWLTSQPRLLHDPMNSVNSGAPSKSAALDTPGGTRIATASFIDASSSGLVEGQHNSLPSSDTLEMFGSIWIERQATRGTSSRRTSELRDSSFSGYRACSIEQLGESE